MDSITQLPALRERMHYWKKRLRLSGWRIKLRWAAPGELDAEASFVAEVRKRQAVIRLQPLSLSPADVERDPLETSLIHELLHLHFEPVCPHETRTESVDRDLEQAIDSIAFALYRTEYPKWKDPFEHS